MKIRMIATAAGPQGTFPSGKIVEVPDDLAQSFIAGGYAQEVAAEISAPAMENQAPAPETAALEPPERAIMSSGKAKRK
jgi:hypothetical protein